MAKTRKKKSGSANRGGSADRKKLTARRVRKTALRKAAEEVAERLTKAGYEAVFAGGCVRDMLMGAEPADYDIATSAAPHIVQDIFPKNFAVGAQFGVVVVRHKSHEFEVATYRLDSTYSDGRHPDSVTFGSAREDVMRRDFTINGMLFDPAKNEVIDYVEGREDLKKKVVRCIGDPYMRFAEDKLRMLRAVRFAVKLGFEIEDETREAVRSLAPQIDAVSQERIKSELEKILTCPAAAHGVRELDALGLLAHILPELHATVQVRISTETLFDHCAGVLSSLSGPSFDLALAALLHCCGGADERENLQESARLASVAARRLKCSNAQRSCLVWLVQNQFALEDSREQPLSRMKRLFANEHFEKLMALFGAKVKEGCAGKADFNHAKKMYSGMKKEEIKPEPILTGTDLIEMGLKPSKLFSTVLEKIYDAQLDGELTERSKAIEMALHIARES